MVGTPAAEEVKEKVEQIDEQEAKTEPEAKGAGVKPEVAEPERLMGSHAWLFEGAEPGRLPALLAEIEADAEEGDEDDDNGEEEARSSVDPPTPAS